MGKHKPETRRRLNAEYRIRHRDRIRQDNATVRLVLKESALERYGKACARCGFSDSRALQIDHIENNGADERNELGGQQVSGWRFYRILKQRGWPDGYQTLCANCNLIKYEEHKNLGPSSNGKTHVWQT